MVLFARDNGTADDEDEVGFDVEDLGMKHNVDWQSWYRTISFSAYRVDFVKHERLPLKDSSNQVIFKVVIQLFHCHYGVHRNRNAKVIAFSSLIILMRDLRYTLVQMDYLMDMKWVC